MAERESGDVFRWETYECGNEKVSDPGRWVGFTLLHAFFVGAVLVVRPVAGLLFGAALAVFWGVLLLPTWWQERRAVEWAEIRPGASPVLVLGRVGGAQRTHPLGAVSRIQLLRTGYRSAAHPDGGQHVLELSAGGSAYRTQAGYAPPANNPALLAEALRLACPQATVEPYQDRTTWTSDGD
ncbi:hypothetical protein ACIRBX_35230 [Kitasatospora sp. NPDC096147]|uniref:hypothetical protein n=1 Tax=Kitasatospora sp. NPDC096147 TaxID=3364093 RepID=UPI003816C71C